MRRKIGEHEYETGRLDARRQFHIVRRVLPILASLSETTLKRMGEGKSVSFDDIAGPIAERLASMLNDDVDYILTTCLSVCSRIVNGSAAYVQAPKTDQLMFPDIDMQVMMKLTMMVIEDNMGDFFTLAQLKPNERGT